MTNIPINPKTGKSLFNIPPEGWGTGWKAGPRHVLDDDEAFPSLAIRHAARSPITEICEQLSRNLAADFDEKLKTVITRHFKIDAAEIPSYAHRVELHHQHYGRVIVMIDNARAAEFGPVEIKLKGREVTANRSFKRFG